MQVRSFKLTTGEELVATLISETGLGYIISKPLVIHVMRGPDGQGQLAFAQWSMVQDPNAEIELYDHGLVAVPAKVIGAVEDSYVQQTSSIILPQTAPTRILQG